MSKIWVVVNHDENGAYAVGASASKQEALDWAAELIQPMLNAPIDWQDDPDAADGLAWTSELGDQTVTVTHVEVRP